VVSKRVEFPDDVLRLEEQPGQGLINAEPKRTPGPFHVGCAQSLEMGVVEEILVVVPCDEAVAQGGDEGGDDQYGNRNRNQPGPPIPGRQRFLAPPAQMVAIGGGARLGSCLCHLFR
jgi:hypothetical protein